MSKNILFWAIFLLILISCDYTKAREVIIGEGQELSQFGPFDTRFGGNIIQILLTKNELQKAKAKAGYVNSIAFRAQGNDASAQLHRFRVRMSNHNQDYFYNNTFENPTHIACGDDSPESVFSLQANTNAWIEINMSNPYYWDGNSNLLIEVAWTNNDNGADNQPHNIYAHEIGDEEQCRYLYLRQKMVPNLSSFARPRMSILRPNIKLGMSGAANPEIIIEETELEMGYLDENSISDYRKVEFSAKNLTTQDGEIICTTSQGLLVSLDLEDWKEFPENLSISYTNGTIENKVIYCKMKTAIKKEMYEEKLKIKVPGIEEKIVKFTAKGGSIFNHYCKSAAHKSQGGDISSISIFQEDGLIFTNGQAEPIYNREDCNNKYSNFINVKKIPLRENTEYRIKVSIAHSGSSAKSGKIKLYLDYNRNAVFGIDELIWTEEKTREGNDLESNAYWGKFTIPSRACLSGDSTCLLRVVYDEDKDCNACGLYDIGETEDYAVKLIEESRPLKTALSGEYTIGGNPENEKHYNNLQNLVNDIEKYGIGGDLTLAINTNLNIPEGKSIKINNPSKHKIIIYPREKTRTISGNVSSEAKAMIQLTGNIEINGKIDSETERNALKINNLSANGTAIYLAPNNANSIVIKNINIDSENGIKISGNNIRKIEINDCKFETYENGINIDGVDNQNIIISENRFSKGGGIGISGSEKTSIENNEFDLSSSTDNITNYAISLLDKNNDLKIKNNIIYNLGAGKCAGGISINSTQNSNINMLNNAINCNSASNGIVIKGRNINAYHNTVFMNGEENSSAINICGGEKICLKNNLFVNNGFGVACVIDNSSSLSESKNNNFYAKDETKSICEQGKKMSLIQWQKQSGKDINSTNERVSLLEKNKQKCILSLESALNEKLLTQAINEVKEDLLGSARSGITHKGVDEAIPEYEIGELPDKLEICSPDTIKLNISAKLLKFNDDIKRGESKNYTHKFRYYWHRNGEMLDSSAGTYYALIDSENLNKPIEYSVEVATHGQMKKSNVCKVFSEHTIEISKEPAEQYEISNNKPELKIEFEAIGTISGYQWQKLVKNKWENLPNEKSNIITVSNEKNGVGTYRALIYDGEYKCNNGMLATRRTKVTINSRVSDKEDVYISENKIIINSDIDGYAKVKIIDVLGRVCGEINEEIIAGKELLFNATELKSGIYFVLVDINNTVNVAKIIKKTNNVE